MTSNSCNHDYETVSGGASGWRGREPMDVFYEYERCTKCGEVKDVSGGGDDF